MNSITGIEAAAGAVDTIDILASAYRRTSALHEDVHELPDCAAKASRSMWDSVAQMGSAIMREKPRSLGDVALQLAMAASWLGVVCDALDHPFTEDIAKAIDAAVSNSAILIAETVENLPVSGDALDLLNDLYAEAVRCRSAAEEQVS